MIHAKVFHFFRHGFIDACRAKRLTIPKSVETALVGHANDEAHAMYGSVGYSPEPCCHNL